MRITRVRGTRVIKFCKWFCHMNHCWPIFCWFRDTVKGKLCKSLENLFFQCSKNYEIYLAIKFIMFDISFTWFTESHSSPLALKWGSSAILPAKRLSSYLLKVKASHFSLISPVIKYCSVTSPYVTFTVSFTWVSPSRIYTNREKSNSFAMWSSLRYLMVWYL